MEIRKLPPGVWLYAIAAVLSLIAFCFGLRLTGTAADSAAIFLGVGLVAVGALGLIGILVTLPIVLVNFVTYTATAEHSNQLLEKLEQRLQEISIVMNMISEQQLLSDRAKQVAFREKDCDVVRRAIQEEVGRQEWEVAFVLANDLETSFGYKAEADRARQEITKKRDELRHRQLAEILAPVDRYIKAEAWGAAVQEAHRVMQQYPTDPDIQRLPDEIESRRQLRKQQLRESWQEAVDRHDVDGSIEILKKLDLYLTPSEAESMQEMARDVFKEKREDLRTRFAMSVTDRNWTEAIKLGDEIINDFPNTRIAQEVREKMDVLRQRAAEPAGPPPAPTPQPQPTA